jgi:hypothetical protein
VDDKEPFLSRWSRRKLETKEDAPAGGAQAAEFPAAGPAAPLAAATPAPAAATTEGITPEYREFFDPRVDEKLRRTALKKLFGDPQFNVMDGLDTYIDDYSKPDPIPEAMLRQLNQAKDLFLFDDENKTTEGVVDEAPAVAEGATAAAPAVPADPTALPDVPPAGVPDEAAGTATSVAAAPARESVRHD